MERLNLIFDADDTLWENNSLYERVIGEFIAVVDHPTLPAPQVRTILDEIEEANSEAHGFGPVVFLQSLTDCYRKLVEVERDGELAGIARLVDSLTTDPPELIAGVRDTLAVLAERHDLLMLTKGPPEEQRRKIDQSGLAGYFGHTVIVPEKNVATYERVLAEHDLDPAATWMIGNSPRSDIHPALAAGMGAVLIPHQQTWVLEQCDLPETQDRFVTLDAVTGLVELFAGAPGYAASSVSTPRS
jgi:putative hydrolase of the HAD superfamily